MILGHSMQKNRKGSTYGTYKHGCIRFTAAIYILTSKQDFIILHLKKQQQHQ